MSQQIWKGNVVTPNGILEGGVVVVENGVIQAVSADARYRPTEDLGQAYIAPGFIDVHVHGIAGADTMASAQGDLEKMAAQLALHGVTGFLPTTVTQSMELTLETVRAIRDYMAAAAADGRAGDAGGAAHAARSAPDPSGPGRTRGGWDHPVRAKVLGIHLEGPWISKEAKGAQNGDYIVPPDMASVDQVLDAAGGTVRIVSLAPEHEGAREVIEALARRGVYASIAHTTASYEQAEAAIRLGARHVTHCFNAMTGLHHRNPGVVGAALLHDDVFAELIADGVHVHPAVMRLLVRVKGRDRVMLISDSISAADMPDGQYSLGGLAVYVRDGQARLADGTLAGSTLTLDKAVRNLVQLCGVPLCDAVYMASATPAMAIGCGAYKGQIRPGYDADLVVLDASLHPVRTVVAERAGG